MPLFQVLLSPFFLYNPHMFLRILSFALKNLFRNLFVSLGTTIVSMLLFFFISILIFLVFLTDTGVQNVNNRLNISLTIKDNIGAEIQKVTELKGKIQALHPNISVEFLSRQDALDLLMKRNPKFAQVLEGSKDNPLPSTLQIGNIPLQSYEDLQKIIRPYASILLNSPDKIDQSFTDYKVQYNRVQKIVDILLALKSGAWLLLILFALSMFTILSQSLMQMVITWKDELEIIRLVG
jgi:cell division protein FtsX